MLPKFSSELARTGFERQTEHGVWFWFSHLAEPEPQVPFAVRAIMEWLNRWKRHSNHLKRHLHCYINILYFIYLHAILGATIHIFCVSVSCDTVNKVLLPSTTRNELDVSNVPLILQLLTLFLFIL